MELKYTENKLQLHQEICTGESEELGKFRICIGSSIYVEFDNLKGAIPKIELTLDELIESAYNHAKKNNLIEDLTTKALRE